mmetsp:Transcript_77419/g.240598  ORF Transcript_77419/g.240598 Transcript_77419/m.240598 type:complete len:231 (+) Transcript_77419:390-1082(+)
MLALERDRGAASRHRADQAVGPLGWPGVPPGVHVPVLPEVLRGPARRQVHRAPRRSTRRALRLLDRREVRRRHAMDGGEAHPALAADAARREGRPRRLRPLLRALRGVAFSEAGAPQVGGALQGRRCPGVDAVALLGGPRNRHVPPASGVHGVLHALHRALHQRLLQQSPTLHARVRSLVGTSEGRTAVPRRRQRDEGRDRQADCRCPDGVACRGAIVHWQPPQQSRMAV